MAVPHALATPDRGLAATHFSRVAQTGTSSHRHRESLLRPHAPELARSLADLVHLLCQLHGRYPGLIDLVLSNAPAGAAREWLRVAADAMEGERHYLVRLTAAVGPLPSTPGAAQTESALLAMRHALETLAASERRGCALGAASALVADWLTIRPLLDKVADRHGIKPSPCTVPDHDSIADVVEGEVAGNMAAERGFAFGAEQMLLQHRGLFDLLDARAGAREAA